MGKRSQNQVHAPRSDLRARIATYLAEHPRQAKIIYVGVPLALIGGFYLARLLQGEHSTPPTHGLEYHAYFASDTHSDGLCANVGISTSYVPAGAAGPVPLTAAEARHLESTLSSTVSDNSTPVSAQWLKDMINTLANRAGLPPGTKVDLSCTAFNNIGPQHINANFNGTG